MYSRSSSRNSDGSIQLYMYDDSPKTHRFSGFQYPTACRSDYGSSMRWGRAARRAKAHVDKSIHSQSDGVDSATSCTAYTFLCSVDSKRYETEVSARDWPSPIMPMESSKLPKNVSAENAPNCHNSALYKPPYK